jgi:hypothetical protein
VHSTIQTEIELPSMTASLPTTEQIGTSDLDLQLCRRLDWRFLLPDSRLGNVAYIGEENLSLVRALQPFSTSFTFVSEEKFNRNWAFDGVVITSVSPANLDCAARVLNRGAWLYAESDVASRRRIKGLHRLCASVRCRGFEDVRAYWHRPNFESCREIVPMQEIPLNYVLARQQADIAGRVKSLFARVAKGLGLLPSIIPSISVVAVKQ